MLPVTCVCVIRGRTRCVWIAVPLLQARSYFCLILGAEVRIWQPRGHVQHEGINELAHLVGHVDVLAASLDDNLLGIQWTSEVA